MVRMGGGAMAKSLEETLKDLRAGGYSEGGIRNWLVNKGFPSVKVDKAMAMRIAKDSDDRRSRLHRALDCVLDARDSGRAKDVEVAESDIRKMIELIPSTKRSIELYKSMGGAKKYQQMVSMFEDRLAEQEEILAAAQKKFGGRAKDALDDRQFLNLMEKVGILRDSTRSLRWPGDDNPKVQQASTDTYNVTMSKVKSLIASSGMSPQEFRKRGTKVATKAGRRINLNWIDSLDRH